LNICFPSQGAWVQIPSPAPNAGPTRVSAVEPLTNSPKKAHAHPLLEAIEAFLLTKRVGGCTQATLRTYRWWHGEPLARLYHALPKDAA